MITDIGTKMTDAKESIDKISLLAAKSILKNEKDENEIKLFLLPKDEDDNKNSIVEIRAGTGGLEATLFCADLFKMYEKVCSKKK